MNPQDIAKKYGATFTVSSANDIASKYGATFTPKETTVSEDTQTKPTLLTDLTTLYGGGEQSIGSKLISDIQAGAKDIQDGQAKGSISGFGQVLRGIAKSGLRTAGDAAGAIFAPVASVINSITGGKLTDAFSQIQKNIEEGKGTVGEAVSYLSDNPTFQKFAIEHPNAAEDFNRAINIAFAANETGKIEPTTIYERTKTQLSNLENRATNTFKITPEIQNKSVDSLENDYYKWSGSTKSGAKMNAKLDAKTEALNNAGTTGTAPQRTLAEMGIVPETEGTKFATTEQANSVRETIKPLNDALNSGLKEVDMATEPKKINELRNSAQQRISKLNIPEGDKQSLFNDINTEFDLLEKKYGDSMTAQDMQNEKPNYWKGTKFDSTKPFKSDAYYQVAKSFQKGIEDMANNSGFEDVAQLNRVIGDRLEAAKFLDSMNGNTLKFGKIGKYVFMGIGASLGHGVVGKVLGALGGEAVGEILMKADVANPVKRLILRSIEQQSPEAYQATIEWLDKQGQLRNVRPLLNSGGTNSTINQGRPIKVGNVKEGEYVGKETIAVPSTLK